MSKKERWLILAAELIIVIILIKNLDKFKQLINPEVTPILDKVTEVQQTIPENRPVPTITVTEAIKPTTQMVKKIIQTSDTQPWGVSKQIDAVTWTLKVGEDPTMATNKEIFDALNTYRKRYGSQVLNWDDKLTNYAQERAKYLNGIKSVDEHAGFKNFLEKEDGFNKLGFTSLGENISYGYKLNGVHTIEWMYAGDKPHNDNQLDNRWNYVGIGVNGLATCIIFGTGKF